MNIEQAWGEALKADESLVSKDDFEAGCLAALEYVKNTQKPLPWQDVVAAIVAVSDEASERGGYFPQCAEEQREARQAARRVCEQIEWYATNGGSVAEKLKGWPKYPTMPSTQPDKYEIAWKEWDDKTAWFRQKKLPFMHLGMHWADVIRRYIEHLEALVTMQQDAALDNQLLVWQLDVLINGKQGSSPQASLCDIVAQVKKDGLVAAQPKAKCVLCGDTGKHGEAFAGFPPEGHIPKMVECQCQKRAQLGETKK